MRARVRWGWGNSNSLLNAEMNDGEQISCHRWKRYVLLIFLSTIPGVALAKNCIQIKNIGASSVPVLQLVRKPGRYCLAKHIHQEIVTRSYTRSRLNLENSYLLATVGSRIELDLMGLAITSSFQSLQGVGQNGLSAILHEKSNAGRYLPPQNLKLINGRIELAGRSEGVSIPRMSPGGSIHAD